jgi:hypothetical protein
VNPYWRRHFCGETNFFHCTEKILALSHKSAILEENRVDSVGIVNGRAMTNNQTTWETCIRAHDKAEGALESASAAAHYAAITDIAKRMVEDWAFATMGIASSRHTADIVESEMRRQANEDYEDTLEREADEARAARYEEECDGYYCAGDDSDIYCDYELDSIDRMNVVGVTQYVR